MLRIILIGHDETRSVLRDLTIQLRARRYVAAAYFDENIMSARQELDTADFLLLGLSRAGRQPDSKAHITEERFLDMASREAPAVRYGLISDIDGYISAPYLATHGALFTLVASDSPEVGSLGLFERYQKVSREPEQIVSAMHDLLTTPSRATA